MGATRSGRGEPTNRELQGIDRLKQLLRVAIEIDG
jgi:hypothetical protein